MGMLILVAVFLLIALAVGFGAGAWLFQGGTLPAPVVISGVSDQERESLAAEMATLRAAEAAALLAAERATMAYQRIQDVAKGMASDADDHASRVDAITTDLQTIATDLPDVSGDAVLAAINRIAEVNHELQQRLSLAEKHIESQTSELRSYESEARTDSLTGLANRRAFDDELQKRYSEWQRQKTPFTLLILDVDKFKTFNDTHGHLAGDEVLRNVGRLLAKAARQVDLACRYGGEEFAVVLPGTDIQEARIAAERFRKAIEGSVVTFGGKQLAVTASIGLAQIGGKDDQIRLIRRADEALYKSKAAGRNCGHWHDGEQCYPLSVVSTPEESQPAQKIACKTVLMFDRLPSKKAFVDNLQQRVAESQRFGIPLSVIQLRIEGYAAIKQKYGREVARTMLDSVAQFAQSTLRQMDLLARLGEAEFVVMLPRCKRYDAAQVADRLQAAMASGFIPNLEENLPLASRYGIAQLRAKETGEEILARAAEALDAAATAEGLGLVAAVEPLSASSI
jgi:diguanylate cyclase